MASHRFSCTQYFTGLAFLCSNIYLPWLRTAAHVSPLLPSARLAGVRRGRRLREPAAAAAAQEARRGGARPAQQDAGRLTTQPVPPTLLKQGNLKF